MPFLYLCKQKSNKKITLMKHLQNWQTFDELLVKNVLPDYSKMKNYKLRYLFAHIIAMRECKIISDAQIRYNFSNFCRHLGDILNDTINRAKAFERYNYPKERQELLTKELMNNYLDK